MLNMDDQELRDYLNALQEGDEVIETGRNGMQGLKGTVYYPEHGSPCVKWVMNDGAIMGTAATAGTRLIEDA